MRANPSTHNPGGFWGVWGYGDQPPAYRITPGTTAALSGAAGPVKGATPDPHGGQPIASSSAARPQGMHLPSRSNHSAPARSTAKHQQ